MVIIRFVEGVYTSMCVFVGVLSIRDGGMVCGGGLKVWVCMLDCGVLSGVLGALL